MHSTPRNMKLMHVHRISSPTLLSVLLIVLATTLLHVRADTLRQLYSFPGGNSTAFCDSFTSTWCVNASDTRYAEHARSEASGAGSTGYTPPNMTAFCAVFPKNWWAICLARTAFALTGCGAIVLARTAFATTTLPTR